MNGIINTNMTYKVQKALKKFDGDKARGIALIINSEGGSPAQAHIIQQKFETLRDKYSIPIYTFAQDYALSSAFLLLTMGDRIYCDNTSLVGSTGTKIQQLKIQNLLNKYDLEARSYYSSNESLTKMLDPSISEKSSQQLQSLNDISSVKYTELLRKNFSKRDLTPEKESKVQEVLLGEELLSLGLADGLINQFDAVKQLHQGVKIEDLTRKTSKEKAEEFFASFKTQIQMKQFIAQ